MNPDSNSDQIVKLQQKTIDLLRSKLTDKCGQGFSFELKHYHQYFAEDYWSRVVDEVKLVQHLSELSQIKGPEELLKALRAREIVDVGDAFYVYLDACDFFSMMADSGLIPRPRHLHLKRSHGYKPEQSSLAVFDREARNALGRWHSSLSDDGSETLEALAEAIVGLAAEPCRAETSSEEVADVGRVVGFTPVFRKDGEMWKIGASYMKNRDGFYYIKRLLEEPENRTGCFDLWNELKAVGNLPFESSDAGPVLDQEAIKGYQKRLQQLAREREEAQTNNDPAHLQRVEKETKFIKEQLSRDTGLGGRSRRVDSPQEKARKKVTMAMRRALIKICTFEPALAEYLRNTIQTGISCAYFPTSQGPSEWTL